MSKLKPSDVLEHAADLIAEWGWHRGASLSPDGAMCHIGAIYAAAGRHVHQQGRNGVWTYALNHGKREVALSAAAIGYDRRVLAAEGYTESVTYWNDHLCKSQREAIAKLRKAARLARKEGQ